ncbi:CsbD family protein [Pseudorhodoferax sp.]|uniref:CsbD family protein n=1 Tax=Pseudorhodoferax sp. TaxID=1993553 RepID=UPI002DD6A221|nr:CsbD family protein [Pseudorhodoferax sp.]
MLEQAEGIVQNIAGRVQDAFGAATGDAGTQLEGKARQVAGKAQQAYGDVLDTVRESAVTNPLGTVAAVAGVGFILGALWARR